MLTASEGREVEDEGNSEVERDREEDAKDDEGAGGTCDVSRRLRLETSAASESKSPSM